MPEKKLKFNITSYTAFQNVIMSIMEELYISLTPNKEHKKVFQGQTLSLNGIRSDNETFDTRCNDLEEWLIKRGYTKKQIRKQILNTQKHSRNDLLERKKSNRCLRKN